MQVIPVLDLQEGVVVRGVGGKRATYRPWRSPLAGSCNALAVARALTGLTGHSSLYIADLDAILRYQPNFGVFDDLLSAGMQLQIDAGVTESWLSWVARHPDVKIILGLESLESPEMLDRLLENVQANQCLFSLDLFKGKPICSSHWTAHPLAIVERVISSGINAIIVLDLVDVGQNTGGSTRLICEQLRQNYPKLQLTAGGGIRSIADLYFWQPVLSSVLVASALHDGRLQAEDLEVIQRTGVNTP